MRTVFRSLRYRNYRLFFIGQAISLIGTWTQQIALPWLVYRLTDSALLLGVVSFATQIPVFVLTSFAGVMSDRWNRYTILLVTQTLSMIQAVLLCVLYFTGVIHVWHILALSVMLGIINAFDMPTRQAFVISLVDSRDDLANAIALNSMMFNSARLIGPSVAGVLIAAAGEGVCFLVNAVSFLFVIVSLLMIKVPAQKTGGAKKKVLHELREGLAYVGGFVPLRYIILLLALVSMVGMPYAVLVPVFASKILGGGPHTFGFLMGAAGIGALTGATYLAARKSILGLVRLLPWATMLFGCGLIAFSLSRWMWISLPVMFFTGLGMITQLAACNTIIQTIVDDDKRGRVMSIYVMSFIGIAPFGSLLAGFVADRIGAPNTLLAGGILCVVAAGLFWRKLPLVRKEIRPIYIKLGILPAVPSEMPSPTAGLTPPGR